MAKGLPTEISGSPHGLASHLVGSIATRPAVDASLGGCDVFLFFGHGTKGRLQGSGTDLVDALNVGSLSGTVVVAIACWSAVKLGPDAISAGAKAYLGFDDLVAFLPSDPDDEFGDSFTAGIRSMLTGADAASALGDMRKRLDLAFDFYRKGAGAGRTDSVIGWLCANWDKSRLTLLGNGAATL